MKNVFRGFFKIFRQPCKVFKISLNMYQIIFLALQKSQKTPAKYKSYGPLITALLKNQGFSDFLATL
jgi:hypothetical protein